MKFIAWKDDFLSKRYLSKYKKRHNLYAVVFIEILAKAS